MFPIGLVSLPQVGPHLFLGASDPWISVNYTSNANGMANVSLLYPYLTFEQAVGHALVVHSSNGSRLGCGVLRNASSVPWLVSVGL